LGILPVAEFREEEVSLEPGDTLLVYTDGITEAEDPDGEEFGEQRLLEVVVQHCTASLPDIASAVERAVDTFARGVPFKDDRTLVMIRREE
jgi:sigma-B regulation protein RsbU (phosphoserine phosphatase)